MGERDRAGGRSYVSAAACGPAHPCPITQVGALEQQQRPLLFQRPVETDHSGLWFAAHRVRNDVVVNFDELLEDHAAEDPEIYIYGIELEYPLSNADLIDVEVHREDSEVPDRYYFRYWDTRLGYSLDLTTLFPIRAYAMPQVRPRLDAATVTLAVSLRVFQRTEPDAALSSARFLMGGLHPTVLIGAFNEFTVGNQGIVKQTEVFVGGGVTAARFLGVGVAWTLLDPARGGFPYAAIHVDEMVRLIAQASVNREGRWERYEEREGRR